MRKGGSPDAYDCIGQSVALGLRASSGQHWDWGRAFTSKPGELQWGSLTNVDNTVYVEYIV
jgi:hypothetical protein